MTPPRPASLAGVAILAVMLMGTRDVEAECAHQPDVDSVITAIFAPHESCDVNGDQLVTAADIIRAAEIQGLPACPPMGGSLDVFIDNYSGVETASATVHGELVEPSCQSQALAETYRIEVECEPDSKAACGHVDGLLPGTWRHRFESNATTGLQLQYRKGLLTSGDLPESLRFRTFASIFVVTNPANAGNGSLRNALQAAPDLAKPLLIRFDDLVFPPGVLTVIALDFPLTRLETDDVTIDATDAFGEIGNRIVDAQGSTFGVLSITGARNHVIGLRLRNAGEGNRDIVQISGAGALANVLERCIIENAVNGDAVGIDDMAGTDFDESVNVLRECEISGAADKGVKVTTGAHGLIERSWIHHNANGGVQATLGGNALTIENVIEDNSGSTAENGLAAQGFEPTSGASQLLSRGDIVRRNGASGFAIRGFALGRIRDGYLAANGRSGLRVFNDVGSPAVASAEGTTVACNASDGAVVADGSRLDLGGGEVGSGGNNALTRNSLTASGINLRNATVNVVGAINNQWEHCGNAGICNHDAIAALDIRDLGLLTLFDPAQAHRASEVPVVTRVSPTRGREGELLRIYGRAFNAIDGHGGEEACVHIAASNACLPLKGNCVRIGDVPAVVEAVTPTMLVVRWPFTCVAPVPLTVTVQRGEGGMSSQPMTVCTGSVDAAGN
jgi:hypothetical protein